MESLQTALIRHIRVSRRLHLLCLYGDSSRSSSSSSSSSISGGSQRHHHTSVLGVTCMTRGARNPKGAGHSSSCSASLQRHLLRCMYLQTSLQASLLGC